MSDRSSPPPPSPDATGRHSTLPSESDGTRALRKVIRLEEVVGGPSNPLTLEPGTGLHAVMERVLAELKAIATDVAALRQSRGAWSERGARIGWIAIGVVVALIITSLWGLLVRLRLS